MKPCSLAGGRILAATFLLGGSFPVEADWKDSLDKALETTTELVDSTEEAGQEALEKAQQLGRAALESVKEVREKVTAPSNGDTEDNAAPEQSEEPLPDSRFQEIWGDVLDRLEEGLAVADQMEKAPESSWIRKDKSDIRSDLDEILEKLVVLLDDREIVEYRVRMSDLRKCIAESNDKKREYREARVAAPIEDLIRTTRAGYDKKIEAAEADIEACETEIEQIKYELKQRLQNIGIALDMDQVSVLLSRVDSADILQMASVFNVLKTITAQLMSLMSNSGEDISYAKRYYGMHLILLEMVVHMQTVYMSKVDHEYLPRIDEIVNQTLAVNSESRRALENETEPSRRRVYEQNIQAQKLTLKAAHLYMENLKNQRDKVEMGREKVMRDLQLAQNTYRTVEVSADLLSQLQNGEATFAVLLRIQAPEIVPFENLEMQKKYEELSQKLAEDDE